MKSSDGGVHHLLNTSALEHQSAVVKVFGYQNINLLMKNGYCVHDSSILKLAIKLKEFQSHPEMIAKTPSPRTALHGGRKALEALVITPSFDVDSFSLKSPPRLSHAHTINSEILSASIDVSSVNLLQNNPRNPIIVKRNPNIERMIQDSSNFRSPKHSPGQQLKPTFSSFGLYRSVSCSSTGGSFSLKDNVTPALPVNWSNNTSIEDMSSNSSNNLKTLAHHSSTISSGSGGNTSSGSGSTDTSDYTVLCTQMEEVMTMLNETSPKSRSLKESDSSSNPNTLNINTSKDSPISNKIASEPNLDEIRQYQNQLHNNMREFVGKEYSIV